MLTYINFDKNGDVEISNGEVIFIDTFENYKAFGGIVPKFDAFSYTQMPTLPHMIFIDGKSGEYDPIFDKIIDSVEALYKAKKEKDVEAVNAELMPKEEPVIEEPEYLTDKEKEMNFLTKVYNWFNDEAIRRGYFGFADVIAGLHSDNPQTAMDAKVAAEWRDKIRNDVDTLFAKFERGETDGRLPDFAEWIIDEPILNWQNA